MEFQLEWFRPIHGHSFQRLSTRTSFAMRKLALPVVMQFLDSNGESATKMPGWKNYLGMNGRSLNIQIAEAALKSIA
jgi:hypothetical protein